MLAYSKTFNLFHQKHMDLTPHCHPCFGSGSDPREHQPSLGEIKSFQNTFFFFN